MILRVLTASPLEQVYREDSKGAVVSMKPFLLSSMLNSSGRLFLEDMEAFIKRKFGTSKKLKVFTRSQYGWSDIACDPFDAGFDVGELLQISDERGAYPIYFIEEGTDMSDSAGSGQGV